MTASPASPAAPGLPAIPLAGAASPCLANACTACCHDTEMLLTEADVARLRAQHPGVDFAFEARDGYVQLRTRAAPSLPGMAGKPCVFLGTDGNCSTWATRPEGCRLYPALWDDATGTAVLDTRHCPHTGGFVLDGAAQAAVGALAERLHKERDARVRRRGRGRAPLGGHMLG